MVIKNDEGRLEVRGLCVHVQADLDVSAPDRQK